MGSGLEHGGDCGQWRLTAARALLGRVVGLTRPLQMAPGPGRDRWKRAGLETSLLPVVIRVRRLWEPRADTGAGRASGPDGHCCCSPQSQKARAPARVFLCLWTSPGVALGGSLYTLSQAGMPAPAPEQVCLVEMPGLGPETLNPALRFLSTSALLSSVSATLWRRPSHGAAMGLWAALGSPQMPGAH